MLRFKLIYFIRKQIKNKKKEHEEEELEAIKDNFFENIIKIYFRKYYRNQKICLFFNLKKK